MVATYTAPAQWTALHWLAVGKVVALMGVPLIAGLVSGVVWVYSFKSQVALDMAALQQRQAVLEKAVIGLESVPSQLAALTARFDTWAQAVGLPTPQTLHKDKP